MDLQIQNRDKFLDMHLKTALHDWDMNEEIKLTTTTDQFYQDEKRNEQYLAQWHYARISRKTFPGDTQEIPTDEKESVVEPNLWLMVDPTLACPLKYPVREKIQPLPEVTVETALPEVTVETTLPEVTVETTLPRKNLHMFSLSSTPFLDESLEDASLSSECQLTDDDESLEEVPVYSKMKNTRKRLPTKKPPSCKQSRRLQRALQDSRNLKSGAWLRPPVNYCILIAIALSSSKSGSLNVQQIYNFTREHFPFFLTAPDGWKNTIRHNLCFSTSFKKTPLQVTVDGKRRSCLWHLTPEGRRRLRNEIHTLTEDSFKMLERSMNHPEMIQKLFEL